jgi:hypothetical protein
MNREFIEYLISKRLKLQNKLSERKGIPLDGNDPCSSEKEQLIVNSLRDRISLIENIEDKYWSPYE